MKSERKWKPSIILVENIFVGDMFKWFFDNVRSHGGDGAGAIVCKNFKECSIWFEEWLGRQENYPECVQKCYLETCNKTESETRIDFCDDQENIIFTNDKNIYLSPGEYVFIVSKECYFGYVDLLKQEGKRKLIPVDSYQIGDLNEKR